MTVPPLVLLLIADTIAAAVLPPEPSVIVRSLYSTKDVGSTATYTTFVALPGVTGLPFTEAAVTVIAPEVAAVTAAVIAATVLPPSAGLMLSNFRAAS